MNNEQLNAAKDQAAKELGYKNFGDVIMEEGELNTVINRAMEIYAEMEIKAIKEYADSFHGSGHEYWFILSKIDDLIRHKLNKFKTTKP